MTPGRVKCEACGRNFRDEVALHLHIHMGCRRALFQLPQDLHLHLDAGPDVGLQLVESGLDSRTNTLRIRPTSLQTNARDFLLLLCRDIVQRALLHVLTPQVSFLK